MITIRLQHTQLSTRNASDKERVHNVDNKLNKLMHVGKG